MKWFALARKFKAVVAAFAFLAASPVVLNLVAEVGPPHPSASVLAALISGVCIALTYIALGRARREGRPAVWVKWGGAAFLVLLPSYTFLESRLVYRTGPPNEQRRVRGFVPVNDEARRYIEIKGSVREALQSNNWESEGVFTESSESVAQVLLFVGWNAVFAALCVTIAAFAHLEHIRERAHHKRVPRSPPAHPASHPSPKPRASGKARHRRSA